MTLTHLIERCESGSGHMDDRIVEAVARAIHASPAFQPAYGPWQEGARPVVQQHCILAARAAITAYQAEVWQPIETAPKNGDAVFLWGYLESSPQSRPHIGSEDRFSAYWNDDHEAWGSLDFEGWVVCPTYWQPLPPSPSPDRSET